MVDIPYQNLSALIWKVDKKYKTNLKLWKIETVY